MLPFNPSPFVGSFPLQANQKKTDQIIHFRKSPGQATRRCGVSGTKSIKVSGFIIRIIRILYSGPQIDDRGMGSNTFQYILKGMLLFYLFHVWSWSAPMYVHVHASVFIGSVVFLGRTGL